MAGTIVRVIPPRVLDFSALANGKSLSIVLKRALDVSEWVTASMAVRINAFDTSGGSIVLAPLYEGPSFDDPGMEFTKPFAGNITLVSSIGGPLFKAMDLGRNLGGGLRFVVTGTRSSSAGNIAATLGVDVKLTNYFPAD